jgi:hypothetical protein
MKTERLHTAFIEVIIFFIVVFGLLLNSCGNQRINRDIKRLYKTKIVIPDNMFAKIQGKDTLLHEQGDIYATLIVWYDSVQCALCKMNNIEKWNRLFLYSKDSVIGLKPMVIFTPGKKEQYKFEASLKITDFKYPIYVDYDHVFEKMNPHLSSSSHNVFLLDKNKEIVLVGNPFYNNQMWKLYKNTIGTIITHKGIIPIEKP